jgi:hypothetical protein
MNKIGVWKDGHHKVPLEEQTEVKNVHLRRRDGGAPAPAAAGSRRKGGRRIRDGPYRRRPATVPCVGGIDCATDLVGRRIGWGRGAAAASGVGEKREDF